MAYEPDVLQLAPWLLAGKSLMRHSHADHGAEEGVCSFQDLVKECQVQRRALVHPVRATEQVRVNKSGRKMNGGIKCRPEVLKAGPPARAGAIRVGARRRGVYGRYNQ